MPSVEGNKVTNGDQCAKLALVVDVARAVWGSTLGEEATAESVVVKVFGCRPLTEVPRAWAAGVGKPPREETAGRETRAVRRALWGFECRECCA
jgi:hypothetical protein